MDKWLITSTRDDAFGIAAVAAQIASLVSGLRSALELADSSVLVWELHDNSQSVGRAAIQVRVGHDFFEQFFNSCDGYRAMFRRGRRIGSAANAALIDMFLSVLSHRLPVSVETVLVRKVGDTLQLAGRKTIDRSTFLRSLDPSLAKVWYATAEIGFENIRPVSFGVSGGKIDVGLDYPWKRIEQDPADCIIEIKGAFVGPSGLFQGKDPEMRATGLSRSGGA
jgi:hypothetical protein